MARLNPASNINHRHSVVRKIGLQVLPQREGHQSEQDVSLAQMQRTAIFQTCRLSNRDHLEEVDNLVV